MNILDTPGRLAQIGNDVFKLFWSKPSEREKPPEPSDASARQPELRSRKRTSEVLRSGRSRGAPMPSEATARRRVLAVVKGTGKYDAIDVDEDDHDQEDSLQKSIPRSPRTLRTRSLVSDRRGQKDEIVIDSDDEPVSGKARPHEQHTDERSKETSDNTGLIRSSRRSIGILHQPQDAVLIKPPQPRSTRDMSFALPRTRFSGGPYGPVNTLDQPKNRVSPPSTKKAHFIEKTRGSFLVENQLPQTQKPPARQNTDSTQPSQASLRNNEPPRKRLRIDSEQNEGLDRSSSQQQKSTQPMGTRRDAGEKEIEYRAPLSQMYGFGDEEEPSLETRSNNLYPPPPIISSHTSREKRLRTKSIRHNQLFGVEFNTLEDCDEKFMHDATRQRRGAPSDSEDELTTMQKPTHNDGGPRPVAAPKSRSQVSSPTTPTTAIALNSYDNESPDELFEEHIPNRQPKRPRPKLSPINASPHKIVKFPLKTFLYHTYSMENCQLELDEKKKTFSIEYHEKTLSRDALTSGFPVDKIIALLLPSDQDENIVILQFSASIVPGNRCFLQFESKDAVRRCADLITSLTPGIRRPLKTPGHNAGVLAKAYAKAKAALAEAPQIGPPHQIPHSSRGSGKPATMSVSGSKPTKLRDQLDSPTQRDNTSREMVTFATPAQQDSRRDRTVAGHESLPVEGVGRVTRSTQRHSSTQPQPVSPPLSTHPRRQGKPWKRPLTYPRDGIKRESVTWDDLARLEDHEFLNDSLVGLFLRYLQEECKESTKRMHFFSTFFYETLTRSKKGINYQGVCNWTKKIDIFNRDFIIVPVNESAHWFVMIICNPKALMERSAWSSDKDVEALEAADVDMATETDAPQSKLLIESDLVDLTATKSAETDIDYPADQESPRKRAGRRKLKRRSLPKYEINRPVIITLDSLAMGRSPNASVLKDYLIREAYEKRGQVIEKSDIAGMTGKEIPTQGNFSDCGLYLCMYLEQFMSNPDRFVMSILQRDTEVLQWPKHIPHGALRQRLYDMLQSLYSQQHGNPSAEVPPVGHILIRDEDYLTPTQKRMKNGLDSAERYCNADRRRDDSVEKVPAENPDVSKKTHANAVDLGEAQSAFDKPEGDTSIHAAELEAIVIEEKARSPKKVKDEVLSKYFSISPAPEQSTARVPEADPQQLANRLRDNRSPDKHTTLSSTSPAPQKLSRHRHRRSVSTAFLDGFDSYEHAQQLAEREETIATPAQYPDEEFHGFGDPPARYGSTVPESVNGDDTLVQGSDSMLIED